MKTKKVFELTQEGIDSLKEELVVLKDVKRIENLQSLKDARAQGDLSENADYDAARNEQAMIEARITEIEAILKNAKVIKTGDDSTITTGKRVTLKFLNTNKVIEYRVVGTIEANPKDAKISIDSPLGKSIKGKEKGDIVSVKTETGKTFNVEILSVN